MLGSRTILIVDGSTYAALDLAAAVEDNDGCVAGPVATLSEALAILDSHDIAGAIVDCGLPEASALIVRLADSGVPLVPLPPALDQLDGRLSMLMRPADPRTIIDKLVGQIGKAALRAGNKLGSGYKQV